MEKPTKKCEKCKKKDALYSGKCNLCGGQNRCSYINEDNIQCETNAIISSKFDYCTKHANIIGELKLCNFIYDTERKLANGTIKYKKGDKCPNIAKNTGGFCNQHKKDKKEEAPKNEIRSSSLSAPPPLKRQKIGLSAPPPPSDKDDLFKLIDKTGIYSEGTVVDTSFTGETRYDTIYNEEGGRMLSNRIKEKTMLDSLKDFFSPSPPPSPSHPPSEKKSDGKRKSSRRNKSIKKKSRRKSLKKKSRRKSRRINKRYIKV